MNIVCVGGGPAGLYFGLLARKRHPGYSVTVVERNRPSDTFGWGVVFSDQTLGHLAGADEASARAIRHFGTRFIVLCPPLSWQFSGKPA